MGDLVEGDDDLPVEEVGAWAVEKHSYLCRYVDISRGVRAGFIGPQKAGATYIDPFCGPGRSRIKDTDKFIDGSAVAAWKTSLEKGSPFSRIIIGDRDEKRLEAATTRLQRLGAPVDTFSGNANDTIPKIIGQLNPYGLHCAFLDPYSLEALDFAVIKALSKLRRIDMLVHVSQMDLQRNLMANISRDESAFDIFAPGWRTTVRMDQSQINIRKDVFGHWRNIVAALGVWPSANMRLITGEKNQPLYWLLLAAKHDTAHKFWASAANLSGQGSLF